MLYSFWIMAFEMVPLFVYNLGLADRSSVALIMQPGERRSGAGQVGHALNDSHHSASESANR